MKPLAFREVKRKLEAAGFVQIGQTGSYVKFAKMIGEGTRQLCRITAKLQAERFEVLFVKLGFPKRNFGICKILKSYGTKNFH